MVMLMSHPGAARGMLDLEEDPEGLGLGAPSSQLRSRHLGRGHHKTQSPSGQPDAVSKGPGEGQESASQLQHLLGNISTRILLTVLCTKRTVTADLNGWFVQKPN